VEKTIISWNVPNVITIWLMLFLGLILFAAGSQAAMSFLGGKSKQSETSGGY
jgi:hypothetical protein